MASRLEDRGSYDCSGSDGEKHVVDHFVEVEFTQTPGGPGRRDGMERLMCKGWVVDRIAKGRYRTADGKGLTTDHPDAP